MKRESKEGVAKELGKVGRCEEEEEERKRKREKERKRERGNKERKYCKNKKTIGSLVKGS